RAAGDLHSDRGCQYTSQHFATLAREFGVLCVGRYGLCWDKRTRRVRSSPPQTGIARHVLLAQTGRCPHRDFDFI
ncbi:hypothetical protein, partial [Streptomyces stelliscabiei]|uniref:hypothetical protein n=1 Tax=Streptomyces stelliscabiei TaxID=146820 RepID=UPI002FEF4AA0